MSFINPIALWLGLLGGLIVLMYLLKLKRKREPFSSTLLWVKTVEDLTANAPFQKLRQNLLMYLQILFLLLLAWALARPAMWLTRSGVSRIVLIDTTASMSATDGEAGGSRLDDAKAVASDLVENLGPGDQMMIVTFGGATNVVQSLTGERGLLNSALRSIEPTDGESRIVEALALAQGVRKVDRNAIVTVISDGGVGYLGNVLGEDDPIDFLRVGEGDENVAIVAFDLRESFEHEGELQVFAEIENFGSAPADILLRCLIDGQIVQVKEQEVAPQDRAGFVFTGLQGGGGPGLLRIEIAGEDLLASDNAAQGLLEIDSTTDVLLVTNGNFFLERALALVPDSRVEKIAPEAYDPTVGYDIVVFDQFAPEQLGPGRYMFLNVTPPFEGFGRAEEPLADQFIIDWNRLHPATRYANFENLFISESLELTGPEWAVPLVESDAADLVFAGESQGVRVLAVAFDIYATDWPLQVSFPIFFANAVGWLAGADEGRLRGAHGTGETIAFATDTPLRVTSPTGRSWDIAPNENGLAYFNQTHRVGLYSLDAEGGDESQGEEQWFAVNLLSPKESDIAPRGELLAGEQRIVASSPVRENREIWHWIAIGALALLAIEWHIYCRRSWL